MLPVVPWTLLLWIITYPFFLFCPQSIADNAVYVHALSFALSYPFSKGSKFATLALYSSLESWLTTRIRSCVHCTKLKTAVVQDANLEEAFKSHLLPYSCLFLLHAKIICGITVQHVMPVKTNLHVLQCSLTSLGPILNTNIWFEGRGHYVCVTIADNGEYKASNQSLHLFNAKTGHSYSCRNESVYMGSGLYLEVTQDRMQAFNLTKGNEFGSRKCLSNREKSLRAFLVHRELSLPCTVPERSCSIWTSHW